MIYLVYDNQRQVDMFLMVYRQDLGLQVAKFNGCYYGATLKDGHQIGIMMAMRHRAEPSKQQRFFAQGLDEPVVAIEYV